MLPLGTVRLIVPFGTAWQMRESGSAPWETRPDAFVGGPFEQGLRRGRASMGPRPSGRGNVPHPQPPSPVRLASMGPRPSGRGNSPRMVRRRGVASGLQWGLDLPVEETQDRLIGAAEAAVASMGPRPSGRGNKHHAGGPVRRRDASMGPRPSGRGNDARRRSPRSCRQGFNGASTFRSRKPAVPGREARGPPAASMGPRPSGRGNTVSSRRSRPASSSFNGASTFRSRKHGLAGLSKNEIFTLQWGLDLPVEETDALGRLAWLPSRFNGASTFRSRKPPFCPVVSSTRPALQWGLDLPVEETPLRPSRARREVRHASMGPRPSGRGNSAGGHDPGAP